MTPQTLSRDDEIVVLGPVTMREHWNAGRGDMQRTLVHPEYFTMPSRAVGVVTHDVHC